MPYNAVLTREDIRSCCGVGPVAIDVGGEESCDRSCSDDDVSVVAVNCNVLVGNVIVGCGEALPFADNSIDIVRLANAPLNDSVVADIVRVLDARRGRAEVDLPPGRASCERIAALAAAMSEMCEAGLGFVAEREGKATLSCSGDS